MDQVKRSKDGRLMNANSLRNLHPWARGRSGNPGGRPKKMPITDAYRIVGKMQVKDLVVKPDDSTAIATAKRLFLRGIEGNVAAVVEIANRLEGKPRRREFEFVPGNGVNVNVEGQIERDPEGPTLGEALRKIDNLNDVPLHGP